MPITPQIEERSKLIIQDIEVNKDLGAEDKSRFVEMINSSKACCNGMTTEEKIQGLAENNFAVNCTLARITMLLKAPKPITTWKDVAIKAMNSWNVVVIIGILAILLGFHPEIAQVIASYGAQP